MGHYIRGTCIFAVECLPLKFLVRGLHIHLELLYSSTLLIILTHIYISQHDQGEGLS